MPEYIKIKTARNVEIEYALAGLGDRVLARIVDSIIQLGYLFMVIILVNQAFSYSLLLIFSLPIMLYSFVFERFNDGQTPGKNILQIKVVSLSGNEVTTSMYFLRWIFLLIDLRLVSGVVGIIAILVSDEAQRIGDIVAGTTVISTKKKATLKNTAFRKINKDYQPTYPEVQKMSDRDIQTIQQVLRTKAENKNSLMLMAAEKIKEVYLIVPESDNRSFLHTIVNDFNFYQYQAHHSVYGYYDENVDNNDA